MFTLLSVFLLGIMPGGLLLVLGRYCRSLCAHGVHSFPENTRFPMKAAGIEAEVSIGPFLPGGFSDQQHLSSVELDGLQMIIGPIARRTSRMRNSIMG